MRLKIIAGNLAVVVLLGLVAFFTVSSQLRSRLTEELEAGLDNDRLLLERSFRLSALEFVDNVSERAATRQLQDVFAGLDVDSRRTRAYEAAVATHAWFGDPARGSRGAPDIVAVVDEAGKVIARDGARNVMFGKALIPTVPALGRVLQGGASAHDVWREDEQNKVLQVAIAPIRNDGGTVLGALVVAYDLSNGVATSEGKLLGRDVAVLVEGNVYSSSLDASGSRDLKAYLFGPAGAATGAVLTGQSGPTQAWRVGLAGSEFTGVTARLPMAPSIQVGFAVLGDHSQGTKLASVANVILIMLVLGALLVLGYGFMIGSAIMRPIEEIEEGVLAVINGRTDLRLETDSAELGGLAYRINQLLNVFTNTEEASEDAEGKISVPPAAAHWKDAEFGDAPAGSSGAGVAASSADEPLDDPGLAAQLAAESDGAYSDRVYSEYVAAKQALGENVSNIPKDRFLQRLKGRGDALAQKHGCRAVRFQVQTADNQVVLRPVLLR
jgi:hypothetical protein